MNPRYLSVLLLLLVCAVPVASAGGMAKVYLSPDRADFKTGQNIQIKVMLDNNLEPLAKDISIYLDWNPQKLQYKDCAFKVGNTTVAGLISSHELNLLMADFKNGYRKGDYPLAVLTFTTVGPGSADILLKVGRLIDMDGKPVKIATGTGTYTIAGETAKGSGTAVPTARTTTVTTRTTTTTRAPGQPTVIIVTPASRTPLPTMPTGTRGLPVAPVTTLPPVIPIQPAYTDPPTVPVYQTVIATTMPTRLPTIATAPPTPLPTIPTVPTTLPTTVPTTLPTTDPTSIPTTAFTTDPTTVPTTAPTLEATTVWTPNPATYANETITARPTPVTWPTPTAGETLPSPLEENENLTDRPALEPVVTWPGDGVATTLPAATHGTEPGVNNTSVDISLSGSLLDGIWKLVLAGTLGVILVAIGVIAVRRSRDDWL
ncbi:MAG: hypothetical protein GXY82_00155 [Methanospirillum sp.]|nr:hypothetical protein [Methanospirillum sp.]